MYAEHFGLRELPFCNTPDPRYFFATPDHEEALASLIYAVQERKGFVLLTGEIGAGKTLVSRMMLRHFEDRVASAVIHHSVSDAADLLQAIATEFELPADVSTTPAGIVRRLHDYLLERYAEDKPVVLVVDEAQNLPRGGFEQLRMIGNLEADQAKLLQICFVGQPELQEVIRSHELRQLRQRIFRSFHLPPLSRDLTEAYIAHRLKVAGAAGQNIFDMGALDRTFAHSRGIPRVINTLCDNAMLSAYSSGRTNVDVDLIDSVIAFDAPRKSRHEVAVLAPEAAREPATPRLSVAAVSAARNDPHLAEEVADLRAELSRLQKQVESLTEQVSANGADHSRGAELIRATEAGARHAEHTLRRVDRACETIAAGERRARQLGKAVDGMAVLLGPLAAKLEEIASHTSAQLVQAETAAARLDGLILGCRRANTASGQDDSSPREPNRQDEELITRKDAARKQVFAEVSEAIGQLRRAAQQLSAGPLPNMLGA